MTSTPKAIVFLGATGGCGFGALRRSLEAGHICIALCRTPSKLTEKLPADLQGNLRIEKGNALEAGDIARCLEHPTRPGSFVDSISFSIGGAFQPSKMTIDNPTVCENSIKALLTAIDQRRSSSSPSGPLSGKPHIISISSTGITDMGRDVPLVFVPLYHVMLKDPHKDKKAMEAALAASSERWTLVRPSLLTDGAVSNSPVRVGIEDVVSKQVESKAVGYTISREDVGKWIFENLIQQTSDKLVGKAATVTY